MNGLGCTSSCACQKNKGLNGCECDNELPTSTQKEVAKTEKAKLIKTLDFLSSVSKDQNRKTELEKLIKTLKFLQTLNGLNGIKNIHTNNRKLNKTLRFIQTIK